MGVEKRDFGVVGSFQQRGILPFLCHHLKLIYVRLLLKNVSRVSYRDLTPIANHTHAQG